MNTTDRAPALVLCELVDTTTELGVESHSPFCVKIHRALKLAGLPYERRHGSRPSDFAHLNPAAQVPVLLVDGEPVHDSTRILERIDALTGAFSRGIDAKTRAEACLWEEFADTTLNGFLVAARWADDRNWALVRDAYFGGAPWPVRALVAPRLRKEVVGKLVARDVWRAGAVACWQRFDDVLTHLESLAPTPVLVRGEAEGGDLPCALQGERLDGLALLPQGVGRAVNPDVEVEPRRGRCVVARLHVGHARLREAREVRDADKGQSRATPE